MLTPNHFHNYQVKAINHGIEHDQSMFWLDLGLGKTVSSLTVMNERIDRCQVYGVLVVAPLRVVQTVWENEAKKWTHTESLTFSNVFGSKKKREDGIKQCADVYLTNYESLTWLTDHLVEKYLSIGKPLPFNMVVFDEVTKMKNGQTNRHKAFRKILPHIQYRLGLTGTPASNGYKDLFGQYLAIDDGLRLGRSVTHFKNLFFDKTGYMGYELKLKTGADTSIQSAISDITLQMDAKDYLELPEVMFNDIPVYMNSKARDKYERLEKDMFLQMDSGAEVEAFNAAALTNKCLQAAAGAIYTNKETRDWEVIHNDKLDALESVIEEAGGNPILCFYQFQHDMHRILKRFPDAVYIKSGMNSKKVVEIVNRWNNGEIPLLLGHPASMSHGLNLQKAMHSQMVWYGLNWSLELYLQANGRINRQGVQHGVIINRLITQGTLDEAVADALENKATTQQELRQSIQRYRVNKNM